LQSANSPSRPSGNDPPEDEQPSKAPRQVIKNVTTSKKRDEKPAPDVAGAGAGARGGRRGGRAGFTGNDAGELPLLLLPSVTDL